jgi:hypothetical protein
VFDACLDIEWWDLGKNQVREVKVINDGNTRGVYPLLFSANNRALIIKKRFRDCLFLRFKNVFDKI